MISVIFFAIIFGFCLHRRNQQRPINQLNSYPYVQSPIYSVPRPNQNQIINPNLTARIHGSYVEKPPPTYNSIVSTLPPQQ